MASMSEGISRLPPAALDALSSGRIHDAIRAVKKAERLGFLEAKRVVEQFIAHDPALRRLWLERQHLAQRSLRPWVRLLGVGLGIALAAWFVF